MDEVGLFDEDLKQGEHARRIMAAYERTFADGPEGAVLYLLGFFDRPVQRTLIDVLRQAPVIGGAERAAGRPEQQGMAAHPDPPRKSGSTE